MSLGYVARARTVPPPPPKSNPSRGTTRDDRSVEIPSVRGVSTDRAFARTGLLYLTTCLLHTSLLVYITTTTFVYPFTLFRTRLREDVVSSFRCVYDYGKTANGAFFCSDDSLVASGNRSQPSPSCFQSLIGYQQQLQSNSLSQQQGPWLAAYELRTVLDGDDGAFAAKVILIVVQSVTLAADLLKAVALVFASTDAELRRRLYRRGPALQWIEYAVSASFMTVFVSVMSHNFDINFAVSTLLGTVSLMYIGWFADVCLSEANRHDLSLVLIWQPGMLLFAAAWWPVYASLHFMSEVTCKNPDETSLFCTPGCFLSDYNYTLLSFGTFAIFLLFPVVSLYKCFVLSGAEEACLRGVPPSYRPFLAPIAFLGYVPYSLVCSVQTTILSLGTGKVASPCMDCDVRRRRAFLAGAVLNGILSLAAKSLLTLTFVMSFATRFPWRTIQANVA